MFQDHLVVYVTLPWNTAFLHIALVPFSGKWNVDTQIWALLHSLLLGCHWSQTFLVDRARESMYVFIYTQIYKHTFIIMFLYQSIYVKNHEFTLLPFPIQNHKVNFNLFPFHIYIFLFCYSKKYDFLYS